ncbi:HD domain-containing protein [bacterium]|nr:HD domain-containing protein [bacterium]
MQIEIPHYVVSVARILAKEGFKAYLVAGAIRDTLLGIEPHDYDIATDALPEQLIALFPKSIAVGAQFGTVIAVQQDSHGENFQVEVTTLRNEEDYLQGRWPSKVNFVRNLEEDLQRRDFTINALAIDFAEKGIAYLEHSMVDTEYAMTHRHHYEFTLLDYYNGQNDLANKVIRTVGNPVTRFTEDGLRPYRACRFASQLGFSIEQQTFEAIKKCLNVSSLVSVERVRDEFMKLLLKSPKPSIGLNLLKDSGLLQLFLPELIEGIGVEQGIGHAFDVYDHSLRTVDLAPDNVKLAALFHDIAKPKTSTNDGHFYGHDQKGADMTETIMRRLKFSNAEIKEVSNLVRWHMFYYPYNEAELKEAGKPTQQIEEEGKELKFWSDGAVRRFIRRVGLENIENLFALRIADATSEPVSMWAPEEIVALQARISKVLEEDNALKISDLAINGNDVMIEFSLQPNPIIGQALNYLLEQVIEDPNLNDKTQLLHLAKEFINKNA